MEQNTLLAQGEYRFAALVWHNEPIASGRLAALAASELGWKKAPPTPCSKSCVTGGFCATRAAP